MRPLQRAILTLLLVLSSSTMMAQTDTVPHHGGIKGLKQQLREYMNQPFDTVRDKDYWKRALAHGKLDINDQTIQYPRFLDICLDLYRWGDHTFNHYDTAYVTSTGKNWKLMVKNNNWLDSYSGHLTDERTTVRMNSDVTSNFGGQISFMALSLGYMINMRDLLGGKSVKNTRWDFSFTCSRLALELYYTKNDGSSVHMRQLDDWMGNMLFSGLKRESYGAYGYYFFNHSRYAQAAAYCFSKYQRRSAGSFIIGGHWSHQDIVMDFEELSDDMKSYLPDENTDYRFRYRDYCVLIGYGYNWVLGDKWLLNITGMPSIGYRHSFPNSIEGKKTLLSTNFRGKAAVVHNRGNFFYGLHIICDGHWYHSREHSLFNSNNDFNLTAGYRF